MKKIYRVLIESEKDSNKTVVVSVKQNEMDATKFTEEFMGILKDGFKMFVEEIELDEDKTNE